MNKSRFIPPVIVLSIFFVIAGIIFYRQQASEKEFGFTAHGQATATGDPALCRLIGNTGTRTFCETNSIYQWAKDLTIEDCRKFPYQNKKDQCVYQYATSAEQPALCGEISDGYFKRRCHFFFQPEELFSWLGLYTWFNLLTSSIVGFGLIYLLIIIYTFFTKRSPSWRTGAFLGILFGFIILLASQSSPFSALFYHVDVLLRVGCPPNTDACQSGSWISFPTPRGLFVEFLSVPIFYLCLGVLANSLYKKIRRPLYRANETPKI